MATQKTANDYREERKARIARSAKVNGKKAHKINAPSVKQKTKNTITAAIVGVIVLAIAVGSCFYLGVFERFKTIKTVSGDSYSAVEYEYYYKSIHNYYYQNAAQYDQNYGQGYGYYYTGYDYSKLPEDQDYPFDDYKLSDGATATWEQYFEHIALYNLKRSVVLADMAAKAGFKASDEATSEAAELLGQLRTQIEEQASQNSGYVTSLGKYLRSNYGKGMTEGAFQTIVDRETLANEYYTELLTNTQDGYTEEQIKAAYDKDAAAYASIDFRMFTVAADTSALPEDATTEETQAAQKEAAEKAKKNANEMFGKITDEASFIKLAGEYATDAQKESYDYSDPAITMSTSVEKSAVASSFSEEIINWLFGKDAKVGDKKLFESNGTYYLFYMIKTSYLDNTLTSDVRHILYQFNEEAEDKDADKKECKAYADAALKKIQQSNDPLETFKTICASDSDDTNSKESGGLFENVGKGEYVKSFEEWSLDPARKEGDVAVIETTYGYHVMYFVQKHTEPYWKTQIRETLATEKVDGDVETAVNSDKYNVVNGEKNATLVKLSSKIYNEIASTYYASALAAKETEVASTSAAQ